jgi:hypothetical protein
MIRWVLLLLLALNVAYLAYGLHRAQISDVYGGVPPLELSPGSLELELLASEDVDGGVPPLELGPGSLELDLDAARAAAEEQALALREAHQAMNRRGADRAALQATLDQVVTQLHREQSLVNRIQGGTLYQVRTGDTLAIIAARLFGDSSQWPQVFEANRHVLENPDQVWPGTTLIVPSLELGPGSLELELLASELDPGPFPGFGPEERLPDPAPR